MNRIALFLISVFLLALPAAAQQKNISGIVTEPSGEPLIGATIMVKEQTPLLSQTLTESSQSRLNPAIPSGVTYVGFQKQIIKVAASDNLTIVMQEEANTLTRWS